MARAEPTLQVSVAYSPRAGVVDEQRVALADGATLIEAIRASGLAARHPELDLAVLKVGVWGRVRPLETRLRENDRVEVYRPLIVDPKEARRARQRKQGGRAAGKRPAKVATGNPSR